MDLLGLIMLLLGWGGFGTPAADDATARSNPAASVHIASDGTPAPW